MDKRIEIYSQTTQVFCEARLIDGDRILEGGGFCPANALHNIMAYAQDFKVRPDDFPFWQKAKETIRPNMNQGETIVFDGVQWHFANSQHPATDGEEATR